MKATYIDHMGSDLSVVNAARVSFGKKSEWEWVEEGGFNGGSYQQLSKADQGLIQFLARGCTSGDWEGIIKSVLNTIGGEIDQDTGSYFLGCDKDELTDLLNHVRKMPDHWTPFGHTAITLHIKAPIFVARQLGKHQVGFVWNEVSRRYITDEPEFYVPETWRKAAENVKQGSSDETLGFHEVLPDDDDVTNYTWSEGDFSRQSSNLYKHLLLQGVAAEQARMVLPQSMYTEWYWTGNLYGFANVYNQRTDPHAQKEVRDVAHQIGEIIEPLFPVSWKELTK